MELKVVNALNRDIEREQLNKILKYLHESIVSSTEGGLTEAKVAEMIARASPSRPSSSSSAPTTITVSLTGDVEGTGQGTSSITVPVNITKDLVGEAPVDSGRYWRYQGGWETVPFPLLSLAYMSPSGFGAYNEDDLEWNSRVITGASGNIEVTDGDGVSGDPVIDLSVVPDSGIADTLYKIDRDSYGRVVGTQQVTSADLLEILGSGAMSGEALVADGISPPIMLTDENEEDFIYEG